MFYYDVLSGEVTDEDRSVVAKFDGMDEALAKYPRAIVTAPPRHSYNVMTGKVKDRHGAVVAEFHAMDEAVKAYPRAAIVAED